MEREGKLWGGFVLLKVPETDSDIIYLDFHPHHQLPIAQKGKQELSHLWALLSTSVPSFDRKRRRWSGEGFVLIIGSAFVPAAAQRKKRLGIPRERTETEIQKYRYLKHRKNCECCPVLHLIDCHRTNYNCNRCLKSLESLFEGAL